MSERLFLACIPHASDERKAGRDRSFSYAEKEASDQQAGERLDCGMTTEDNSPGKAVQQLEQETCGTDICTYLEAVRYFPSGKRTIRKDAG